MGEVIDFQKYWDKKNPDLNFDLNVGDYFIFYREFDKKWVASDPETDEVIMSALHYDDLIYFLKCNELYNNGY